MSDGWTQVRGWLAKRLGRPGDTDRADLERLLDAANEQANALPAPVSTMSADDARRLMLEAYWAGYLAALADNHPELVAVLTELPERTASAPSVPAAINNMSGTVTGHVVQAQQIDGGIHFS
jgi:hypothetical protein